MDPFASFLAIFAETCRREGSRRAASIADEIERLPRARRRNLLPKQQPATAFLDGALAQAAKETADLVGALAPLRPLLRWRRPDKLESGWKQTGRVAWAELVGPESDARIPGDRLRLGIFLQGPRTVYPMGEAVGKETFMTLTGTGTWWDDSEGDEGTSAGRPGTFHRNKVGHPRTLQTLRDSYLAIYAVTDEGSGPRD